MRYKRARRRPARVALVIFMLASTLEPALAADPPIPPISTPRSELSEESRSERKNARRNEQYSERSSERGNDEDARVRVALVDSGVNYLLPSINSALARYSNGSLIAYDFWDLDDRPFDAHPTRGGVVQRHGTQTASVLLREAPFVELVAYRYPRPDMTRMRDLLAHAAANDVRIIGLPLGGNRRDQWQTFDAVARKHPDMLFVVSAGNDGRDIDVDPVFPAALELPNMLVVTSADDFAMLAEGVNWGRISVDYLVPAESVPVLRFDGSEALASGSSYAVPRVVALAARMLRDEPTLTATDLLAKFRSRFADGTAPRQVSQGFLYDPQIDTRHRIAVTDTSTWSILPVIEQASTQSVLDLAVPLDVLIIDNDWEYHEVSRVLREAQQILARCGFVFSPVQLRRVAAPAYLRDLAIGASKTLMDAVRLSGRERRVTVVFARDTRMATPFDAEAFGKGNTRTRSWLTDSVWLTQALVDRDIALAHELFHVLSNSGKHSDVAANLMLPRTTGKNRQLGIAQCDSARSSALSAGLANER